MRYDPRRGQSQSPVPREIAVRTLISQIGRMPLTQDDLTDVLVMQLTRLPLYMRTTSVAEFCRPHELRKVGARSPDRTSPGNALCALVLLPAPRSRSALAARLRLEL